MTNKEIFAAWSPEDSIWSTWVKPVLFAHLRTASPAPPQADCSIEVAWAPPITNRFAMVLDLPGDEGVWVSVALSSRGYRPVPLYNALPLPCLELPLDWAPTASVAAVNVHPIVNALKKSAEHLAVVKLPPDARPTFLLHANRQGKNEEVLPDQFDNRSICFTTDFPSANFLLTHGIQRVLLVQRERTEPQADLAHVLCRWQDGGLRLQRMRIEQPTEQVEFQANRPPWYGAMFQRALAALGLRRAPGGGFGAWMPESPAGG